MPFKDKFGYPEKYKAVFKKKGQASICYICEIEGEIKLGDEHDKYQWVDFKKAMKLLTHDNSKKLLRFANSFFKKC